MSKFKLISKEKWLYAAFSQETLLEIIVSYSLNINLMIITQTLEHY